MYIGALLVSRVALTLSFLPAHWDDPSERGDRDPSGAQRPRTPECPVACRRTALVLLKAAENASALLAWQASLRLFGPSAHSTAASRAAALLDVIPCVLLCYQG